MEQQENLLKEIEEVRKEYRTDNYPMSIGELISMYSNNEMVINPEFQRYFRWTNMQRTKLIESFLLGIPVPAIFTFQRKDGKWEVVDGLQRISTILQFVGILELKDNETGEIKKYEPLKLTKTKYLSNFDNVVWEKKEATDIELPDSLKLYFKRAKLNFIIILPESDPDSKYEVFQRLNKGGTFATNQELRNCIMVMVNKELFKWLKSLTSNPDFNESITISQRLIEEQYDLELVLKFITCRFYSYSTQHDFGENIDETMQKLLFNTPDLEEIKSIFDKTFSLINKSLGDDAFKKFNGTSFRGKFLDSAFEAITTGLSFHLDSYSEADKDLIADKVIKMWQDPDFTTNIGSGLNAASRIPKVILFSKEYFRK